MLSQLDITESHALVVDVFKGFRGELMASYGKTAYSTKSDDSPVTLLDVKIETRLKDKLLALFPAFGFKGEETEEIIGTNGAVWLVDPIDSTSSYIHGLPYCSNMAGLVVDGEIVASVIYHFATDELFTALKGQGAYRNGEKIFIQDVPLEDSCVFADAYSYKNIYQYYSPARVKFYAPLGATGYFFTRLAQGSIQGVSYLRANIKQHDIAAGILLSSEAGAEAVSFIDAPFDFNCLRFMVGTKSICNLTKQFRDKIVDA